MANYSIAGDQRSVSATLVANTPDVITFANKVTRVKVEAGNADIFVTVDGSTPTVNGQNAYRVQANSSDTFEVMTSGATVVQVISPGTPTYTVEHAPV